MGAHNFIDNFQWYVTCADHGVTEVQYSSFRAMSTSLHDMESCYTGWRRGFVLRRPV